MRLANKIALVTGAGSGFGEGIARTFARRKEIAIRSAIGASRSRIVQQLLSESLVISLCGGVLGLVGAHFGIGLLTKVFAAELPRMGDIGLNGPPARTSARASR